MATLTITKGYDDGALLTESLLDPFKTKSEVFYNTTKLNDDNLQNAGITASTKFKDGSITEAKFSSSSVVEAGLADLNVNSLQINASAITTAKLNDGAATTAKIADLAVTTAKFIDGNISDSKLAAPGLQLASSSGVSGVEGTTYTLATLTVTSVGRPLIFGLSLKVNVNGATGNNAEVYFELAENSSVLASVTQGEDYYEYITIYFFIEAPSAGTHTYIMQATTSALPSDLTLTIDPFLSGPRAWCYEL